jgi:rod shape-determining protein MreD
LRAVVTFLVLLLLWVLVSQLNHALAGWHVFLFIGGLFITYPALALPLRDGLAATLVIGLVFDAASPVTFGLHALLFGLAHTWLFNLRDRLPRDELAARVVIALLANLALFLVFSFTQISRSPAPGLAWTRLIGDLLCSQVVIAAIAPWFFALQRRSLVLARAVRGELL